MSGIRWRLQQMVRAALYPTTPASPLRRAYSLLRRMPIVRGLWRSVAASSDDDWRDPVAYAGRGGVFAESSATSDFGVPPEFESENFFDDLLARAQACHPPQADADGPIVLVNNGLSAGGAERQIVFTLKGLKARGERALFVGEYFGRSRELEFYLGELESAGVEWRALPNVTKPGADAYRRIARPVADAMAGIPAHMMVEMLDLVDLLRTLRPRVVHLWLDETSTKQGVAAILAGAPRIVLSGRNVNPTHFNFHQPYMAPAYRALARSPRVVLSNNSAAGARSYEEWLDLPKESIKVVYNAVDFDAWPEHSAADIAAFRRRLSVGDREKIVAGVFRLADEKRPLLWLKVAAAVKEKRPDAVFVIAGDGPMRRDVETEAEALGISASLRLLGETKDVSLLLSAADAVFLASRQEGTPNALIEAQRYGACCVVTDVGGAPETIEHGTTGLVVGDDDPYALAAALQRALSDESLRQRARETGPSHVAIRFGMSRMIDDTLSLYAIDRNRHG